MNAKKRIINLIVAGVLILLQLTPIAVQPQNIYTKILPNQNLSQPTISELFIENDGMPGEFFVAVDKKCDLIVTANDPDWDMIRVDIFIKYYIKGEMNKQLIHTIWSPQNSQRYRINLIPFLMSFRDNIEVEVEVTDSYEMKEFRNVNLYVKNIFGMEFIWDNRGREAVFNRTWWFDAQKDRNIQRIDLIDPQYEFDKDYREKQDYEFNLTLVWDQRSNSSDKLYFGFRTGYFIQKQNYDDRFSRIYDTMLPSDYKSILAGEEIHNDWTRIAGFYFTIQPTNLSDLVMPWILKVKYPAWYEPQDPQTKPLRLLRFNSSINKWELMDQSSIVKKADPNTVELFINSTGLFAFGRYSWDYEEEIRNLERNDSIPGFPLVILSAVSSLGIASVILKSKRKINE